MPLGGNWLEHHQGREEYRKWNEGGRVGPVPQQRFVIPSMEPTAFQIPYGISKRLALVLIAGLLLFIGLISTSYCDRGTIPQYSSEAVQQHMSQELARSKRAAEQQKATIAANKARAEQSASEQRARAAEQAKQQKERAEQREEKARVVAEQKAEKARVAAEQRAERTRVRAERREQQKAAKAAKKAERERARADAKAQRTPAAAQ